MLPRVDPFGIEVRRWVSFNGKQWHGGGRVCGEVKVVFHGREEGEKVFFELEADEFFGTHVTESFGTGGIALVPGVRDCLSEEVDPATVGGGEGKGGTEGGGGDVDGCFVELRGLF